MSKTMSAKSVEFRPHNISVVVPVIESAIGSVIEPVMESVIEPTIESIANINEIKPIMCDRGHTCVDMNVSANASANAHANNCKLCACIDRLYEFGTTAVAWWADIIPECDHFMMMCDGGHRFITSTNPSEIKGGCAVCAVVATIPHVSCINSLIYTRLQSPMAWFCSKCRLPFLASAEMMANHPASRSCPHTVKIGGVSANAVISKNIIEAVFGIAFDGYGADFGEYRPVAYSTTLKIALHYEHAGVPKWTYTVRRVCEEKDIKLIYVPNDAYTARSLVEFIVRECAKLINIPDIPWMIEEIIPGAFMTVPREPLAQSFNSRCDYHERKRLLEKEIASGHAVPPISHPWRGPTREQSRESSREQSREQSHGSSREQSHHRLYNQSYQPHQQSYNNRREHRW